MPASASSESRRADLTVTLREIAWKIHRTAPDRAGVGPLPTTEIALLKQVLDFPGSTVGELARALGLRQPNVSAALRVLGQRGLVRKEPDAVDRRVVRIFATEHGTAEHAAIAAAWTEGLTGALADLSPEQLDALDGALEALQALHRTLRA